MIEYWPCEQGIHLNKEVANLFFSTKQKLSYNLSNKTKNLLYIDFLDNYSKNTLFSIVLVELEILMLDIVELDLSLINIKLLNYKILCDLIQKSLNHFSSKFLFSNVSLYNKQSKYLQAILCENKLILEYFLIYCVFGASSMTYNLFAFENISTPREHVAILLENLIIQISNVVIFNIIENLQSLIDLTNFIQENQFCNTSYVSIRSVALFRNSLLVNNLIYLYINQPKQIYSSRYKVFLISSYGIVSKYIYISRQNDFILLSGFQLVFIFFMESQDLLIPQVEKFLLILSKVILYIFINLIGNSAIFCIRMILAGLNYF